MVATPVTVKEKIWSIPFDIGPLPTGDVSGLTPEEVLVRISQQDVVVEYFTTRRDFTSASIKVGIVTDHSLTDDSTANEQTFRGYVIEGGHSTSVSSGPDRPTSSQPALSQITCHVLIVVNADTGEIRSVSEIGE